jgi:hypothetical protein
MLDSDGAETADSALMVSYLYTITLRELQAEDSTNFVSVQRVSTASTITVALPSEVQ